MNKWEIYTPDGVRDIMFEECYAKRNIEDKLRNNFRLNGYFEVESPILEYYDTFAIDRESAPQEAMFKFSDQKGRLLVLRPDITIPVARIAASKLKNEAIPLRISYVGNTFRYNESGGGRQKEFTQAGAELMGADSKKADTEIIALAINTLKKTGLVNFQIDIGHMEFFNGLMEETNLPNEEIDKIKYFIDKKDFIGIEEIIEKCDITAGLKTLILDLPKLFGGPEVISKARQAVRGIKALNALDYLESILVMLKDFDLEDHVFIDLGMVQSLNYYTGIVFRGYTHGTGFPVLSGGRYDTLVGKFGTEIPATGFSVGLNILLSALERQSYVFEKPGIDSLVCYEANSIRMAYKIAEALKAQSLIIEIDIFGLNREDAVSYARSKNIGGILFVKETEMIEIFDIDNDTVKIVSMNELLGAEEGI